MRLLKLHVTHRRDNLLGGSVERSNSNPNPSEEERAHRALFAFIEDLRRTDEFTLDQLIGRIQDWPTFAMEHGYQIEDPFWGELVIGGETMSTVVIQTQFSGVDGHFVCAVVKEVFQYPESAVDDVWAP